MLHPTVDEITIVTMFLDLGIFKKGERSLGYHSPYKYKRWMRTFGRLANPVVAFVETDRDVEYFREIRSCLPSHLTKIIKIQRENITSFSHLPQIKSIYAQPSYPKHYPNTVYPEYTCAMNAKYDVLEQACAMDFFKTRFFSWLDIGYFRGLDETHHSVFKLIPPNDFNEDKVAFTQAWFPSPYFSVKSIMMNNRVWVSGGMVLATKEKILQFSQDYKEFVVELLRRGLSNTDQEVIYSMYSQEMHRNNRVKIDAYSCQQGQFDLWHSDARYFCLGYICKDAWEKRTHDLKAKEMKQ